MNENRPFDAGRISKTLRLIERHFGTLGEMATAFDAIANLEQNEAALRKEIEALEGRRDELAAEIEKLEAERVKRLHEVAGIVSEANIQAWEIIAAADAKAGKIVATAEARARSVQDEADSYAKRILNRFVLTEEALLEAQARKHDLKRDAVEAVDDPALSHGQDRKRSQAE
jgi:cell division protein FtsB